MDPRWFEKFPPLEPIPYAAPVVVGEGKPTRGRIEPTTEADLYDVVKLRQIVAAQAAEIRFCREELAKRDAELARYRPKMPANALRHSI